MRLVKIHDIYGTLSHPQSITCGVSSTSNLPLRYCLSNSGFSPTYDAIILLILCSFSSIPTPKSSTPALFETTVKSVEPIFNTAAIKFSGMPQRPNPPTKSLAPLCTSDTASSTLLNTLPLPTGVFSFSVSCSTSGTSALIEKLAAYTCQRNVN